MEYFNIYEIDQETNQLRVQTIQTLLTKLIELAYRDGSKIYSSTSSNLKKK